MMNFTKTVSKYLCCYFIALLMTACQSTTEYAHVTAPQFYDEGFTLSKNIKVETEAEIFRLSPEARQFVQNSIGVKKSSSAKMEGLIYAVFDRSKMNLLYRGDANTVASDTFKAQAANCLSMSIMMYALANEAGFKVKFQEVIIPEYWTRRNGYTLLNGHINLKISTRPKEHSFSFYRPAYQVDFDPQSARKALPKKIVSRQDVVAMFYNNKGADAILKKDFDTAYAYFREAIIYMPKFKSAWVNLGILYRLNNYYAEAEQAYLYALNIDDDSLTAWENLAHLYSITGKTQDAQVILARVERKRLLNPYYHLNLGEQQFERKNWDEALSHFRRALALDKRKHEVYFGLARVYFEIGEIERSERFLRQAKLNAGNTSIGDAYQRKLNFLQDL